MPVMRKAAEPSWCAAGNYLIGSIQLHADTTLVLQKNAIVTGSPSPMTILSFPCASKAKSSRATAL